MMMTRRKMIKGIAAATTASLIPNTSSAATINSQNKKRPKVLFFDSNESMLDLAGMKPQVTAAFEGNEALMSLWFTTMLHYSLVDTVTSNYHDFGTIGAACMQMVADSNGIKLDIAKAKKAMLAMKSLPTHPDVIPALKKMKAAGFKMYTLTNSSQAVMEAQMTYAGIKKYFDGFFIS